MEKIPNIRKVMVLVLVLFVIILLVFLMVVKQVGIESSSNEVQEYIYIFCWVYTFNTVDDSWRFTYSEGRCTNNF